MGRVVRAHGPGGDVAIRLETDVAACVAPGRVLTVGREGVPGRRLPVEGSRVEGDRARVKFGGVESREEAEALVGALVAIPRHEAPPLPEGSFYQADLVGLRVQTEAGEPLGAVVGVLDTGGVDVLVIRRGSGEWLLPAARVFVAVVDLAGRRLVVRVPEGLADVEAV
ncbi:MAG: 16S rRNA processing protein RimM [candidate division NC10 bacterium]|nr:16S rRNA processing protein RimM [candidate division NC10 bacterium]